MPQQNMSPVTSEQDLQAPNRRGRRPMTLGSHQRAVGRSQVHITPHRFIQILGPFDTDPCAADPPRPWDCALRNIVEAENGLAQRWAGRVWLNPPFDQYEVGDWIGCLAAHGYGTALLHARCETRWFRAVWEHASAILFLARRIKFCRPDGSEQPANSGAPPVLVSFGDYDRQRLELSGIPGALVTSWRFDAE